MLDADRVKDPGDEHRPRRLNLGALDAGRSGRAWVQRVFPKIRPESRFHGILSGLKLISFGNFVDPGDRIFPGIFAVEHENLPEKVNAFPLQTVGLADEHVIEADHERLKLDDVARKSG